MIKLKLGDGVMRLAAAAFATAFLALAPAAIAQGTEPAATPPATEEVDTSIPGLAEEAPATTEAAPADEEAAAEGEAGGEAFKMEHIWTKGDVVARATLIAMVIMSLGSWLIALVKYFDQNSLFGHAKKLDRFWESSTIEEGIRELGTKNAFADIAESSLKAAAYGDSGLMGKIDRSTRMSHQVGQAVEGIGNRLSGGMAFLATVGSVSPFIGLFGTVWGIVKALINIGQSGQASIDKVAGPVGEALYMTAIGLFVAVPAVIFYNMLGRRNKVLNDTARHFAVDVESLVTQAKKS